MKLQLLTQIILTSFNYVKKSTLYSNFEKKKKEKKKKITSPPVQQKKLSWKSCILQPQPARHC